MTQDCILTLQKKGASTDPGVEKELAGRGNKVNPLEASPATPELSSAVEEPVSNNTSSIFLVLHIQDCGKRCRAYSKEWPRPNAKAAQSKEAGNRSDQAQNGRAMMVQPFISINARNIIEHI